jgi:hypothetical protein
MVLPRFYEQRASVLQGRIRASTVMRALASVVALYLAVYIPLEAMLAVHVHRPTVPYTIRVNTFRRNDLLLNFLTHYDTCVDVEQVQVVWSDTDSSPPMHFLKGLSRKNVVFEVHKENSLNNRFKPEIDIPTDIVLSIDDDLIINCETLQFAARVWQSSPRSLVGFSPRIAQVDHATGNTQYMRWQHTWWNGLYSIVLTKVCFMHKDFLFKYAATVPQAVLTYVDVHRNCEDLAMAFLVAQDPTSMGPTWVRGHVWEEADGGISSGASHFEERSKCLAMLSKHMPHEPAAFSEAATAATTSGDGTTVDNRGRLSERDWPWRLSQHKADTIKLADLSRLLFL